MEFWPEFLAQNRLREFVAGGVGGMAGVISGHPLDTLKIRMQQPNSVGTLQAEGALGILLKMWKSEGKTSFFKGMGSPLATVAFQNAVTFQSYASLIRSLSQNGTPPSYWTVAWAGAGAGTLQTLLLTPVDLVKIHLQVKKEPVNYSRIATSKVAVSNALSAFRLSLLGTSGASGSFELSKWTATQSRGPLQVFRTILQKEGILGIYRGLGVTLLRDTPGHAAYFAIYEYSRETIHPGCRTHGNEGLGTMLLSGGLAGSLSWLVCYPLDVIKSRLQAQSLDSVPRYKGIIDCCRKSVKEDGWKVLTRGLGVTVARAFLVNAAIFTSYESSLRLL